MNTDTTKCPNKPGCKPMGVNGNYGCSPQCKKPVSALKNPQPALFLLVFIPSANLHVLIPVSNLARDAMGELFHTTKSVLIDANDARNHDTIGKLTKLTITAPYGYAGSRFGIAGIHTFAPSNHTS